MKSNQIKWCGAGLNLNLIRCSVFKKDIGVLQPWETCKRISFRFCRVWCVFDGESLCMVDGSKLNTTTVYTQEHGALIGRADVYQVGSDVESRQSASPENKAFFNALWSRV